MIRSMTAFSGGEADNEEYRVSWELRSVNHRYLDISLRLPEMVRFLEPDIRAAISSRLKRGKLDGSLTVKKAERIGGDLRVDHVAVRALLAAAYGIESRMVNPAPFTALDVLQWPGVRQESEADMERLKDIVLSSIEDTLKRMVDMREREGARLAQLIEERCRGVKTRIEAARQRMPGVLQHLKAKLRERVLEAVPAPDAERLEQELVYLVQKLDVDEELDRLDSHLEEVGRALTQTEPAGRRLDFLMQEMNREANTLGSKSSDAVMTKISVELKVLIEQMREQVQNIE